VKARVTALGIIARDGGCMSSDLTRLAGIRERMRKTHVAKGLLELRQAEKLNA
jgi:hypothetical protein